MKFYIVKHCFYIAESPHSEECGGGTLLKMFDNKHKKEAISYFNTVALSERAYAEENDFEIEEDKNYFFASNEYGSAIEIEIEEHNIDETCDGSFFTLTI